MAPMWEGRWRLRDGGHVASFYDAGAELVSLRLFGVEDQSGMDRLRAECHGLWFEEPAPASVMVQSSGLSETAWALGLTSRRLPTHHRPAIMTLNYPDEDHWTWQRFVVRQHAGTAYFRIPPGEFASASQRAEWARALENRPDLLRRLLEGKPGIVLLGAQVAEGFNEDVHAPEGSRVAPLRGEPIVIGQDAGLTPTSVICQRQGPFIRVIGSVATEHGGMRQHVTHLLRPWLSEHVPWVLQDRDMIRVGYDPSMNTDDPGDAESSPLRIMRSLLPGHYHPGPVNWLKAPSRRDPLMAALNGMVQGQPVLRLDPVNARGLVVACRGGWHFASGPDGKPKRDEPVKNHPHSDYGDALCYALAELAPTRDRSQVGQKPPVRSRFDPINHGREPRRPRVITGGFSA